MTLESTDGFVRVVARRDNHLVLGWQAVGRGVSELAAAFSQSLEMGATLEDVAGTIHAHPTLGEAVGSGAQGAGPRAAHLAHRAEPIMAHMARDGVRPSRAIFIAGRAVHVGARLQDDEFVADHGPFDVLVRAAQPA